MFVGSAYMKTGCVPLCKQCEKTLDTQIHSHFFPDQMAFIFVSTLQIQYTRQTILMIHVKKYTSFYNIHTVPYDK